MRKEIHPEYHTLEIECVCGAKFNTKSTKEFNKVDICSQCHPFYTGKQKVIDTEGRIDKFKKKYGSTFDQLKKKK